MLDFFVKMCYSDDNYLGQVSEVTFSGFDEASITIRLDSCFRCA